MSEWIEHDGGKNPTDPFDLVYVKTRDGWQSPSNLPSRSGGWVWRWSFNEDENDDIIAYKLA